MLRPTPAQTLAGIQRTLLSLTAELSSPYSQAQAASAALILGMLAASVDRHSDYDRAEIDDLKASLAALNNAGRLGEKLTAALARGEAASRAAPSDRQGLEAALADFAAALALKTLAPPTDAIVRGYLARHLERMRALLGGTSMSG